jgi:tRNA (guanine-N7-)-methyltransferase
VHGVTGTPAPAEPVGRAVRDNGGMPTAPAIRSFKHRRGRITAGQRDALGTLWPQYGLEPAASPLDLPAVFGRAAPVVLEIGFGMGEATLAMAVADPDRDVVAVDVHTPGAGALLRDVDAAGLANVRVLVDDAVPVLRDMLLPASLDEVRVFFPDPWPKLKHHKRRLLSPAVVHLVATRLAVGGRLHVATDWEPYAASVLQVVDAEPLLDNPFRGYAPGPGRRPVTRFEQQGLAKGHTVHDVVAERR